MQDALVTLVIIVAALAGGIALFTLATSGRAYREIGRGGLEPPTGGESPGAHAPPGDRDQEIRELLDARNRVREHAGLQALDVDAEIARKLREEN